MAREEKKPAVAPAKPAAAPAKGAAPAAAPAEEKPKEKVKKVDKRGKKPHKPKPSTQKFKFYKVEGDKVAKLKRECPKCGAGVFMAEHRDRFHCGRCSYSEFKK